MARIGINPARGKFSDYRPARVTVAVLVYIPHLDGYFQGRLDVLKTVLTSLRLHTRQPYDLFVFDNGSCSPVVDYLRAQRDTGEIDYLLLSDQNIGKIGAFKVMFHAVPGEIIAYCDDDIFFYPGWLEAHLAILEQFPQVGMVSGVPVRDASRHAMHTLESLAGRPQSELTLTRERRIPDDWEMDWAASTGRQPEAHLAETASHLDWVLHRGETEAIGGANHFQFVTPKQVILQALPADWSGKLMGHMVELDEAVDALGYLRLSTTQRYTRHLGNVLGPQVLQELEQFGLEMNSTPTRARGKKRHWLLNIPFARSILRAIYNRLFEILHGLD